ncbi:MAG TPA: hypothetical protein VNY33_05120 [Gaiellaceae bacterium]|nr:hypothetical protein [Gaiellaceae bacterium]
MRFDGHDYSPKQAAQVRDFALGARSTLRGATVQLGDAIDSHTLPKDVEADISRAETLDLEAIKLLNAAPPHIGEAMKLVQTAIPLKLHAMQLMQTLTPPARTCEATKEFPVYPVPGTAGVVASTNDVFVHNVPNDAKNIKVSFVDLATGRPPTAAEFGPQQTWQASAGDFQTHGGALTYHVNVTVKGQGSGPENANAKDWKVVVTYDCQ